MKFLDELERVLKADERFIGEDNQVIKTKVSDAARGTDGLLIKSLLNNDLMRDNFFTKVDNIYVFDKVKFIWVLESKEFLPDSYTLYKNKIGLVDSKNNLISQKKDVSLVWPYKDCVLEGGQDEEDQKREEVFYNETLAPDEVNRLLAPKVLGNAKRFTSDGVESNTVFNEKDNLIIKGNNLLALSSLLKKYEGRIQLIYIDPPFNTGNDSFNYNDKFNRSTWLTFMKTRLELAHRLLRKDGNIFIHIDNNEYHYLKVLMDEIFGEENYVQDIIWSYGSASGGRAAGSKPVNVHDFILNYAKSYSNRKAFKLFTPYSEKYINDWFRFQDEDGRVYRRRMRGKDSSGESIWEKQYLDESKGVPLTTVWDDIQQIYANPQAYKEENRSTSEIELDFGNSGQKPETLLKRIIEMSTEENDLVLDFFMGSGTTLATSLKLNRKFIGVEQIDSQLEIASNRLVEAIEGKQSGISKEVDWHGGGSFVYCEILEDSQFLISQLERAKDTATIKEILNKATQNGKIIPLVLPSDLKRTKEEFDNLTLEEQKRLVLELLDKNKLYINLSDIDDEDVNVSEADKVFSKSFYGLD